MKIQNLKGFRDFLPPQAKKREWLKNRIISVFQKWGYQPLETPALEPLELFTGQIGEDEKLFYKFRDNGGRDVALRYDQTVPTARVISQYLNEINLPFKRYQIQTAYRAEKPQAGRYREFLQCDADIFGVKSATADAEVIALSLDIYRQLGFKNYKVLINDRSLLKDIPYEAIVAIDKLEKIGEEGVIEDMLKKGISKQEAEKYLEKVANLKPNETIKTITDYLRDYGFSSANYEFAPTIARSFSYSDGPIWEVKVAEYKTGSVLGGERYDNLIKKISGIDIPGTGFGLGFDRTLEAADQLGLIKLEDKKSVLLTIFDSKLKDETYKLAAKLRDSGINLDVYPDPEIDLSKQLKYAAKQAYDFVLILGEDELKNKQVTIKDLASREQRSISFEELLALIS